MREGQEGVEGQVWGGEVNFKGSISGVGEYWIEEGDIIRREEQPPAEQGISWHIYNVWQQKQKTVGY